MSPFLKIIIAIGVLCDTYGLFAQKHDYTYFTQGHPGPPATGIELKYQDSTNELLLTPKEYRGLLGWSPVFSNRDGNFLCYTNSVHLYDSLGRIAINGEEIAVGFYLNYYLQTRDYHRGYGVDQSAGILPITDSLFLLFHSTIEDWRGAPNWAIDITDYGKELLTYSEGLYLTELTLRNDNRIEVSSDKKKLELIKDTLVGNSIIFNKHANGKDWWIYAPEHYSNEAYLFYLDVSTGDIHSNGKTFFSKLNDRGRITRRSISSPNGEYIATLIHLDVQDAHTKLEIKKADRCTGELTLNQLDSFPIGELRSGAADIEWSDNGRFLYLARADYIFQFDMNESDPLGNPDTIAYIDDPVEYAGFIPDYPDEMWRLPNGEILVVSFNATPYLSYIRQPNEKGLNCQFEYITDTLPPDPLHPGTEITISTLPTYPPYRMPPLDQPCVTSTHEENGYNDIFISLYPNPAYMEATVQLQGAHLQNAQLFNSSGQLLAESIYGHFDVTSISRGLYFVTIDTNKGPFVRKLIVH